MLFSTPMYTLYRCAIRMLSSGAKRKRRFTSSVRPNSTLLDVTLGVFETVSHLSQVHRSRTLSHQKAVVKKCIPKYACRNACNYDTIRHTVVPCRTAEKKIN